MSLGLPVTILRALRHPKGNGGHGGKGHDRGKCDGSDAPDEGQSTLDQPGVGDVLNVQSSPKPA
jgi:hypothetical protein